MKINYFEPIQLNLQKKSSTNWKKRLQIPPIKGRTTQHKAKSQLKKLINLQGFAGPSHGSKARKFHLLSFDQLPWKEWCKATVKELHVI